MRILVVTHGYPRFDGDVAGNFVERLARALADRGHDLTVLAPADAGRGGSEVRHGIPVVRVRYAAPDREVLAYRGTMTEAAGSLRGLRTFAALVGGLRREVVSRARAGQVDLVHAHWWLPAGIAAWRARAAARTPYVVTLHGTDVALLRRSAPARLVARRVFRRAAALTAVSAFLARDAARAAGLPPDRFVIQPMPLPAGAPVQAAGPAARALPGGPIAVVTVGRLTAQKRIDLLLEALARLRARGREAELVIVGDGPERPALERLAGERGLAAAVRFAGAVPAEAVAGFLRDAHVFAFPARAEGFGLAAVEALIHGIPVAGLRDGGSVVDLVEQGGGRLVPPDDPDALATALESLAADPAAAARAAQAGAAWRDRLAPDRVAAAFEDVYRQALGTR